jgi:hypothetical protein
MQRAEVATAFLNMILSAYQEMTCNNYFCKDLNPRRPDSQYPEGDSPVLAVLQKQPQIQAITRQSGHSPGRAKPERGDTVPGP